MLPSFRFPDFDTAVTWLRDTDQVDLTDVAHLNASEHPDRAYEIQYARMIVHNARKYLGLKSHIAHAASVLANKFAGVAGSLLVDQPNLEALATPGKRNFDGYGADELARMVAQLDVLQIVLDDAAADFKALVSQVAERQMDREEAR